jgi:hypothetical protein
LNPEDLEAMYYKGSALMKLGKVDDANQCFIEIRKSDIHFWDLMSNEERGPRHQELSRKQKTGKAKTEKNCTSHEEIQWILLELGCKMGLDVWVAKNDRNIEINGNYFNKIPKLVEKLPVQFDERTNKTIELIDVIWLKGNTIIAAFEIESTTTIYSGLLRMSDLISMQPNLNIDLYIVAPDDRREKVVIEINRPTFSNLTTPVSKICRYIPFSKLKEKIKLHHDVLIYLRPSFLKEISESCQLKDLEYEKKSNTFI